LERKRHSLVDVLAVVCSKGYETPVVESWDGALHLRSSALLHEIIVKRTMASTPSTTADPVAGPLMTPFVPPSFCTSLFGNELGVTCQPGGGMNRASACFPNSPSVSGLGYMSSVYSPAIACPVGWTSETQSLSTVTCCPSLVHNGFTMLGAR
jgi:hypothetical protein